MTVRILAFETSTDLASCAIWDDGHVAYVECPRVTGQDGQHSATLLPAAKDLLAVSGLSFADLDAVAFGAGPGAFTGLRMACALAQGVAVAQEIPVVQISTLAAMAQQVKRLTSLGDADSVLITTMLDARMGEVYIGQFSSDGVTVGDFLLRAPREILDMPMQAEVSHQIFCGNVFSSYPEIDEFCREIRAQVLPQITPHARDMVELAAAAYLRGEAVDPAVAAPLYVRDRVAKTIAERLSEGGKA